MIIDKGEIVLTGTDDRQIIYDAMIHYMYSEAEMGRSNHFAAAPGIHLDNYIDISGYAACTYGIDGMCRSDD